ncbi:MULTISPECIES: Calx-beta domain-containing protein [Calothrix]|uniref:Tandem-95 repeat protein n=2 Tax=Calothrix TaxID=1186 RepID=A0ABR8AL84_9CYAN|nr:MULTISPECIES: Calx-beta domain-containing protein [Calothrix]MBD2200773.1 tandem-95 repeat protein [Calothrix parietina FACHB-288]MBD2229807.1 tandem-95 repeat protein [Calothrix anomala FACHB-343]
MTYVDIDNLVKVSENNYALKLESTGSKATHNRLFVPKNASSLKFDYQITDTGKDEVLNIYFNDKLLDQVSLESKTSGFITYNKSFGTQGISGQIGTLTFEIVDNRGFIINSEVLLDNIEFVQSQPLIAEFVLPNLLAISPELLTQDTLELLKNQAVSGWNNLGLTPNQLNQLSNIQFQVTDFADSTLALTEGLTIKIDQDAAGHGWYIDSSPSENSEFNSSISNDEFQADESSPAFGRVDLLTVLTHELGHVLGLPDIDASITPHQLMSATLSTGVRRIPHSPSVTVLPKVISSQPLSLNFATNDSFVQPNSITQNTVVLNAVNTNSLNILNLNQLTSLTGGILNSSFNINNPSNSQFGWNLRGNISIVDEAAKIDEGDYLNSGLSQSFVIPQGAKTLQFKILSANLGSTSLNPPDAFEVALLNTQTMTTLLGTVTGLTQTDALLNIQNDGEIFTAAQVKISGSLGSPLTVNIDISSLQAGTFATLYFDLLGFGQVDSSVTLDDVVLLSEAGNPPSANNDTATTEQGKPVSIDVLANDRTNTTLNQNTLAIATQPTNGTVTVNSNGTITYTPKANFNGTDSFTYTIKDNNGETSNPAAVSITVTPAANNPPVANNDTIITNQNTPVAIAILANDSDIDGTLNPSTIAIANQPTNGTVTINPDGTITFTPNSTFVGTDSFTYTVQDNQGLTSNTASATITVNNLPPVITNISAKTQLNEGEIATFSATATDPANDSLTYTWNFGDSSETVTGQTVQHAFAENGTYNITLTVRDGDGGITTETLAVTVNNLAATITNISGDTNVNESTAANFSATATDPGNDSLTYTWNFGDGSNPVTGENVSHTFADNGTYTVTLTVADDEGAATSSTLAVNVNNVAPTVTSRSDNQIIYVGETVAFAGQFTDPGTQDTHTIVWDFGDGNTVTGDLNPTYIYSTNGKYNVTLTVTDDDGGMSQNILTVIVKELPTLSINDISFIEGDDGNTFAVFTASLSEPSLRTVTANFATADGTATTGSDYLAKTGKISFNPGETTQTITVAIPGDRTDEFDETFFLNLSDATNATIADATGVGIILDNDEPTTFTITNKSIVEGDNGTTYAIFTVNLDALSAKPISVNFATVDGTATAGSDYIATEGIMTFAPGETTKIITVELIGDTLDEYDETFFLKLSNVTNATIVNEFGTGIILDNDEPPVVTIQQKTITTTESGTAKVTFTVSLSGTSAKEITVDYSTVNGTATAGKDYISTRGTLTFAPGETTKTITIELQDDNIDEYDETFFLKLNNALHATIAEHAVGAVTIADNDEPPALFIADKTITEGHDGISYMNFTVSLNVMSEKTISVKYATADGTAIAGSDYLANSGILTFAPGEITKTIAVAIIGDRQDEYDEFFSINLSEAINATITDNTAVATIVDDDESPVLKVTASPAELWPPNHKMVEIKVNTQVSDDFDINPVVKLISITSNEPDNGLGDGDTAGDIEIRADGRIFLRAERSGSGTGRIYTLTYSATDSAGNVTYTKTQIRVPKSKGQ